MLSLSQFITLSQICLYRSVAEILLYCGNCAIRPVHDVLFVVFLGVLFGVFFERTGKRDYFFT